MSHFILKSTTIGRWSEGCQKFESLAGGQFHGMTEKMGQTAAGKWSTLLGLAGDLLFRLYGIIEPLVMMFSSPL